MATTKTVERSVLAPILPEDVLSARFARWGIFARNGRGKSTIAASAARAGHRVLVASVGVENVKPYVGFGGRVRVIKLAAWDDLFPLIEFLKRGLDKPVAEGKRPFYDVLVFDTWTRMQGSAARKIAGWKPPTDLASLQKALQTAPRTPRGFDAWQQIGELSNQWIGYFMDLPMHVLWLFQEGMRTPTVGTGEKIVQTGATFVGPMLTPAAIDGVKDNLDLLGRLYIEGLEEDDPLGENPFGKIQREIDPDKKEIRRLLVGSHPLYMTKGNTQVLGYTVFNPSWRKLEKVIGAPPFEIDDEDEPVTDFAAADTENTEES